MKRQPPRREGPKVKKSRLLERLLERAKPEPHRLEQPQPPEPLPRRNCLVLNLPD